MSSKLNDAVANASELADFTVPLFRNQEIYMHRNCRVWLILSLSWCVSELIPQMLTGRLQLLRRRRSLLRLHDVVRCCRRSKLRLPGTSAPCERRLTGGGRHTAVPGGAPSCWRRHNAGVRPTLQPTATDGDGWNEVYWLSHAAVSLCYWPTASNVPKDSKRIASTADWLSHHSRPPRPPSLYLYVRY